MIGKDIEWRSVSEASQAGTVVVCHEAEQEGGAVGMAEKAGAVTGVVADLWQGMHRFGKPPIEALDHAVGLRPVGTGGAVEDAGVGAEPVDGVGAGRPRCVSGFGAVLEAVGELGAIVGQDRVDRIAEGAEKAGHRRRHRRGLAVGDDLDMGEAADPLDGDEGEFGTAPELAEILEVDMDIAEADWIEPAGRLGRWASLGQPSRQAETDQAAPDRAPRQGRREAAAHHLGDVVEAEAGVSAQHRDERLLLRRGGGVEMVAGMAAIGLGLAAAPATNGGLRNAELPRQLRNGSRARLDIGPGARRRRGIRMETQVHQITPSRCSSTMPRRTPETSNQSHGIKHPGAAASLVQTGYMGNRSDRRHG